MAEWPGQRRELVSITRPVLRSVLALCCAVLALPAPLAAEDEDVYEQWGPRPHVERLRGTTEPKKQVMLAAPVDGKVEAIHVEEGDVVEADALLAQMDDAVQVASERAAKLAAEQVGELREAEAALREAASELNRLRMLRERDAATEWELEQAELRFEQREAAHVAAEERREHARVEHERERLRLEQYRIEAPFDGMIIRRQVEPGASLVRDDPILYLVALDPLEAVLHLPVSLFGRLEVGRAYRLEGLAPVNASLTGRLIMIEPMIDVGSQTFRCVFEIDNPEHRWPAGFTAELAWPPQPVEP